VLASLNDRFTSVHAHLACGSPGSASISIARAGRFAWRPPRTPRCGSSAQRGAPSFPSGGPFVGLLPGMSFPEVEHPLAPRDRLVAYTDGLTEAFESQR
jgi:hypothetical protein